MAQSAPLLSLLHPKSLLQLYLRELIEGSLFESDDRKIKDGDVVWLESSRRVVVESFVPGKAAPPEKQLLVRDGVWWHGRRVHGALCHPLRRRVRPHLTCSFAVSD